jgi:hypothetical protein
LVMRPWTATVLALHPVWVEVTLTNTSDRIITLECTPAQTRLEESADDLPPVVRSHNR